MYIYTYIPIHIYLCIYIYEEIDTTQRMTYANLIVTIYSTHCDKIRNTLTGRLPGDRQRRTGRRRSNSTDIW